MTNTLGGVSAWTDPDGDGTATATVNGLGLGVTAWTDADLDGVATATRSPLTISTPSGPALLGASTYDPAVGVSKATSSLLAMTALDTTNLRVTFTAPAANAAGITGVLIRLRGVIAGATSAPAVLFGVLDGATVRGRQAPLYGRGINAATQYLPCEASSVVTGLTAGNSYVWDAAYAVQTVVASTLLRYGGPNNTVGADAFGGFVFEVWSVPGLLAAKHYDPSTQATAAATSLLAMTAFDTTNLRLTFTAPTSGNVLVRMQVPVHGTTAAGGGISLFGVLDGATVRGRTSPQKAWSNANSPAATDYITHRARSAITGLTPGNSYTWDAAYGVEVVSTAGSFAWGGPDNNSGDNAAGGFSYDIWDAANVIIL